MKRWILPAFAAVLVWLTFAAAHADVIHLKDGRKIEGKIVEETRTVVVIETRFGGTRRIEQDRVLRIERKKTAKEEYETRKKRVSASDPDALFELGKWCKENGLVVESLEAFRKVLALDTNHPGAREELDYVRKDGKWIRKRDDVEVKPDPEPERRPDSALSGGIPIDIGFLEDAGFVRYRGEWITLKEQAKRKEGLIPYKGRFYSFKDVEMIKKGLVKVGGEWMSPERADIAHDTWDTAWELKTLHYEIKSDWPRLEIDTLLDLLERNYREYAKVLGGPPKKTLRIYAFNKHADYLEFLAANKLDKFRRSDAFFDARTGLVVAHSGKNYDLVQRIIGGVTCWQYFKYSYDSAMPGWLAEGISIYFRRFGFDPDGNYVRSKPDLKRLADVVTAMDTDNIIPLRDLVRLEMFAAIDKGVIRYYSAQSWALVNYFLNHADRDTQQRFLRYMDRLRNTFFVMGNAEFIAAEMMDEIFSPAGMDEIGTKYLEAAKKLAQEEGVAE